MKNFAGLGALVSTRIYPSPIPQNPTYPLVTYQKIDAPRDYVMGNQSGLVFSRFQVDSWAETYDACEALAEQVRLSLSNYAGTSDTIVIDWVEMDNEQGPMWDEVSGLQRVIQDYMVTYFEALP
jgi:hypothetical protein